MSPALLAVSYWLHLVATIVWVGGLAMMTLVGWPAARKVLGPGPQLGALALDWQRRFNPLAWLSLAVLVGTGLTQMVANPNYDGLLVVSNTWAGAILLKHLAVGGMIAIGAYVNWWLQPALARLALLEAAGRPAAEAEALQRRQAALTRLNLACGLLVLALTAVARAVS
jgi:uncharacterized membrane protein